MPPRQERQLEVPPSVASGITAIAVLAIARLIYSRKVTPSEITSIDDLMKIIRNLGRTSEDAFEVHIDRLPKKLHIIRECLAQEEYESAVLLFFTAIEGELNTALRIILRIRNFSHGAITDAIKGVDFKTKLDVLLPLVGVDPPPRIRQFARQSQIIRNLVVHFRATPATWSDNGDRVGDLGKNNTEAREFFSKNPIGRLEKDLSSFVNQCVSSVPEVKDAIELVHRFRA